MNIMFQGVKEARDIFTLDKKTVLFCFLHLLPDMSRTMEVSGYKIKLKLLSQAEIFLSIYESDKIRISPKMSALLPSVSETLSTCSSA